MAEKYTLHYFNIRGIHGEVIRYIFAYAGFEYEDHRIEGEQWPSVKPTFLYGQLPALQVGDKTLYQSVTIQRYLGRKFGICGDNAWESAKLDEYADALSDFLAGLRIYWVEKDETKKAEMKKTFTEETLSKYYEKFDTILKKGGPYVLGNNISWFDIRLAHVVDYLDVHHAGELDKYPSLKALKENVLTLPKIKEWIDKRPVTDM